MELNKKDIIGKYCIVRDLKEKVFIGRITNCDLGSMNGGFYVSLEILYPKPDIEEFPHRTAIWVSKKDIYDDLDLAKIMAIL